MSNVVSFNIAWRVMHLFLDAIKFSVQFQKIPFSSSKIKFWKFQIDYEGFLLFRHPNVFLVSTTGMNEKFMFSFSAVFCLHSKHIFYASNYMRFCFTIEWMKGLLNGYNVIYYIAYRYLFFICLGRKLSFPIIRKFVTAFTALIVPSYLSHQYFTRFFLRIIEHFESHTLGLIGTHLKKNFLFPFTLHSANFTNTIFQYSAKLSSLNNTR